MHTGVSDWKRASAAAKGALSVAPFNVGGMTLPDPPRELADVPYAAHLQRYDRQGLVAVLERVDLRGAVALDLADGHDSLRGAVIDTRQLLELAPALADALGITVKGG